MSTDLSRYSMKIVGHPLRSLFSSRCSKSQHGMCTGITKRGNGNCPCDCHKEVLS
jgi:hypothetical protein